MPKHKPFISNFNKLEILAEYDLSRLPDFANSRRMSVFLALGTDCACCGRKATRILKTRHPNGGGDHVDVYANNMIMTIDHIIPKVKGGRNKLSNYQILCAKCNQTKGHHDVTLEELLILVKENVRPIFVTERLSEIRSNQ